MWVQALWQGEGGVGKTSRGSIFGNSRTIKQVYHLFICEVNSLGQANLNVNRVNSGIRLKIRLCTM